MSNHELMNMLEQETSTADLMGLPLPPLFKGEVRPISLSGFIEKRSGKVFPSYPCIHKQFVKRFFPRSRSFRLEASQKSPTNQLLL